MPAKDAMEPSKRKRTSGEGEKPVKKRRSSSDDSEDPNSRILLMEQGILESRKNYNDITVLLGTMSEHEGGSEESMLAAVALCRVFVRLLAQGSLVPRKSLSEKDMVVVGWLKEQFGLYKTALLSFFQHEQLAMTALTLCMRVLKAEGEYMYDNEEYKFPTAFLLGIVSTLLEADDEDVKQAYIEEYAEQYDDIRYYTFRSIK